jgi:pimeloyl-ACP methyl ester carboxylesterase
MPTFALNGADIHYELLGRGRPAFVFVHGGCCALGDWANQLNALGGEFTALAMDLRGHGRSNADDRDLNVGRWAADVNALIDALELGPAVLTGHSLGSRIAAEAAWRRPDNVTALVLLDGSRTVGGLAATTPPEAPADGPPQDPSLAAILDRTVGPHAGPAVRRHVIKTMSAASPAVMEAAVEALQDWDRERANLVFAELPADLPVLAIQSTYHDRFTPRRSLRSADETTPYLDFLRAILPKVAVRVLPDTGHFSMLEKGEVVTALVREFGLAAWRARAAH